MKIKNFIKKRIFSVTNIFCLLIIALFFLKVNHYDIIWFLFHDDLSHLLGNVFGIFFFLNMFEWLTSKKATIIFIFIINLAFFPFYTNIRELIYNHVLYVNAVGSSAILFGALGFVLFYMAYLWKLRKNNFLIRNLGFVISSIIIILFNINDWGEVHNVSLILGALFFIFFPKNKLRTESEIMRKIQKKFHLDEFRTPTFLLIIFILIYIILMRLWLGHWAL